MQMQLNNFLFCLRLFSYNIAVCERQTDFISMQTTKVFLVLTLTVITVSANYITIANNFLGPGQM